MGLTRCYKTAVFYFIFAVFQSQSIAEILPLPQTNERHMEILLPVSILNMLSSSSSFFLQGRNKFCRNWDNHRQSYDFMQIFQDGGHTVANMLSLSGFYDISPSGRQKTICVGYQISTRYLNPPPSYYYFWLLKTNVRHILILLPVSTNSSPSSASDSALAYQILCKSDDRRRSYDVILILQDGGHSVANLLPVTDLATPDI